jgi:hypothetical protein
VSDPRAKHFNRLRRLRRSARRWSVLAGCLVCASAVLLPYGGLGLPDVFWAAAAGGTTALTWWRWRDLAELSAQPVPEPLDPAIRAIANQRRIESIVSKLPIGRTAVSEMHRAAHLSRLRGSQVAPVGGRLDRAVKTLNGLAPRLQPDVLREARGAEVGLRDLAERTASVERALKLPSGAEKQRLEDAHADLAAHLTNGVVAFEGFVAAAAGYVAQDVWLQGPVGLEQLTDATERLRGVSAALAEFSARQPRMPEL